MKTRMEQYAELGKNMVIELSKIAFENTKEELLHESIDYMKHAAKRIFELSERLLDELYTLEENREVDSITHYEEQIVNIIFYNKSEDIRVALGSSNYNFFQRTLDGTSVLFIYNFFKTEFHNIYSSHINDLVKMKGNEVDYEACEQILATNERIYNLRMYVRDYLNKHLPIFHLSI